MLWLGILLLLAGLVAVLCFGRRTEIRVDGDDVRLCDAWLGIAWRHQVVHDVQAVEVVRRGSEQEASGEQGWRVVLVGREGRVPVTTRWRPEHGTAALEAQRLDALLAAGGGLIVSEPASVLGMAVGSTVALLGLVILGG